MVDIPRTYRWALITQTHEQDICVYICVSNLSGYKIGCKLKCIHSFVTTCVQLFSFKVFIYKLYIFKKYILFTFSVCQTSLNKHDFIKV